jgi:hypothetical protein
MWVYLRTVVLDVCVLSLLCEVCGVVSASA